MIQLLEWQSTLVSRRFQCFWHIWIAASKSAFSVTGYTPNTYHHGNLRVPRNPGNRAFNKALLRDILNIMVVKNPVRPYFLFVGTLRFPWYQKGKRRQAFQYISIYFTSLHSAKFQVFFWDPHFESTIFFFRRWWKWRKKAPFTTGFCSSLEGSVIWRAFFTTWKLVGERFFPNKILPNIFLPPPSPCIFKDFVLDIYNSFFLNVFLKRIHKKTMKQKTHREGWLRCSVNSVLVDMIGCGGSIFGSSKRSGFSCGMVWLLVFSPTWQG